MSPSTIFVFLFTITVNSIIGLFVYLRNPKSQINQLLGLFTLSCVGWIATLFLYYLFTSHNLVLFFGRLNFAISVFIPYFFFSFVYHFPNVSVKLPPKVKIFFGVFAVVVALIALFTPWVSQDELINGAEREVVYGALYPLFIVNFLLNVILGVVFLAIKLRRSTGTTKLQLYYLLLGFFLAFAFGITTNMIFPLFNIFDTQMLGPLATIILIGFISFVIIKHRLFDIRLVLARGVSYLVLLAFTSFLYVVAAVTISTQLLGYSLPIEQEIVLAGVALIIALSFEYFKNFVARMTDKLFFRTRYLPADLLRKLTISLNSMNTFDQALHDLFEVLRDNMHITYAVFTLRVKEVEETNILADKDNLAIYKYGDTQKDFFIHDSLLKYLKEHPGIVLYDELILNENVDKSVSEKIARWMKGMSASAILPLFVKKEIIGHIILGNKLTGAAFDAEDINVLGTFSLQAAIGIENILLFMHSKDFNERLKAEVERATTELKQKNKNLEILRKMDAIIATTLDLKEMCQKIVDTVSWEFGYDGALISLVDEDKNVLVPTAVSQTPLIKRAMTLLPKKMEELVTSMDDQKNMGVQAIKLKGKVYTTSLAEALAPVVPKIVAEGMQKIIGTKGIIFYPIFAKDRVLGVICLAMHVNPHDISAGEFNILDAFMEEVGIALENAYLYQETTKANKVLYQTNLKLVGLDKMKDEFVSVASHELRTPMTAIKGYIWMVLQGKGGPVSDKQKYYLERIGQSTQRLINLVNDMLSVSRIEGGRIEISLKDFDIVDMAQSVQEELQVKADEKKLDLVFKKPSEPIRAFADPDKTREILVNLIGNALKFTESGSITVGLERRDGKVYLSVTDTGRGIAQEDLPRLFQKFGRLNNQFATVAETTGTGLGLYICKKYAEIMKGDFEVTSEVGKGSTFTFILPERE